MWGSMVTSCPLTLELKVAVKLGEMCPPMQVSMSDNCIHHGVHTHYILFCLNNAGCYSWGTGTAIILHVYFHILLFCFQKKHQPGEHTVYTCGCCTQQSLTYACCHSQLMHRDCYDAVTGALLVVMLCETTLPHQVVHKGFQCLCEQAQDGR